MMLTLLVAALVGDLIFLPALLASPLGKYFCPKRPPATAPAGLVEEQQESVLESAGDTGQTPHSGIRSKQGETLQLRRDRGHQGPPK